MPIPKNASVTINATANAAAAAQVAANQPSVPSFAESLDGGLEAMRKVQDQVVDAETVEDE